MVWRPGASLQQILQTNGSSTFCEEVFWTALGTTEWGVLVELNGLELEASPRSLELREDCLRAVELEP